MREAWAAWRPPVRACGRATVAQGGYQKWDVKARHPDLVGGMVQHHAAVSPAVAQLPELVQNGQEQFLDARALHA